MGGDFMKMRVWYTAILFFGNILVLRATNVMIWSNASPCQMRPCMLLGLEFDAEIPSWNFLNTVLISSQGEEDFLDELKSQLNKQSSQQNEFMYVLHQSEGEEQMWSLNINFMPTTYFFSLENMFQERNFRYNKKYDWAWFFVDEVLDYINGFIVSYSPSRQLLIASILSNLEAVFMVLST